MLEVTTIVIWGNDKWSQECGEHRFEEVLKVIARTQSRILQGCLNARIMNGKARVGEYVRH